ncbi:MAG: nitrilase-related carbon-nitrogen hydrolase [Chloroflexota bacterium]
MFKIGCLQFSPVLGDPAATMQKLSALLPQAAALDLLVLPELCNSGYDFTSAEQAWETSESVGDSQFIDFLSEICQKHKYHIVSGFNERSGDQLFNSAVLVGPEGYLGKYQKLHLFYNEKDFFQPGQAGLPVFEINGCKLGIQVCFDWMYPEAWRVLALKGADLICHTSNLVLPGLAQRAVPIHAMINRVYTITANRVGTEGELTFTGRSFIADPLGNILEEASATGEELLTGEIDVGLARNKQLTVKNDLFLDRRPADYTALIETNHGG